MHITWQDLFQFSLSTRPTDLVMHALPLERNEQNNVLLRVRPQRHKHTLRKQRVSVGIRILDLHCWSLLHKLLHYVHYRGAAVPHERLYHTGATSREVLCRILTLFAEISNRLEFLCVCVSRHPPRCLLRVLMMKMPRRHSAPTSSCLAPYHLETGNRQLLYRLAQLLARK